MHEPQLEINRWFPSVVAAGAELNFQVRVTCPLGCDLRGTEVLVTAPEGPVMTSELVSCDQGINKTGELMLRAPSEVGDHDWSVLFRPQASEGQASELRQAHGAVVDAEGYLEVGAAEVQVADRDQVAVASGEDEGGVLVHALGPGH